MHFALFCFFAMLVSFARVESLEKVVDDPDSVKWIDIINYMPVEAGQIEEVELLQLNEDKEWSGSKVLKRSEKIDMKEKTMKKVGDF